MLPAVSTTTGKEKLFTDTVPKMLSFCKVTLVGVLRISSAYAEPEKERLMMQNCWVNLLVVWTPAKENHGETVFQTSTGWVKAHGGRQCRGKLQLVLLWLNCVLREKRCPLGEVSPENLSVDVCIGLSTFWRDIVSSDQKVSWNLMCVWCVWRLYKYLPPKCENYEVPLLYYDGNIEEKDAGFIVCIFIYLYQENDKTTRIWNWR